MTATSARSAPSSSAVRKRLEETLALQRRAYFAQPYPNFKERRADLQKLKALIKDNRDAILEAISADYGNRSRHETLFAEIYGILDGLDHAMRNLKVWMKPQRRDIDLKNFFGAKNRVVPQPLGVIGHIVPWNFPIFLCFGGLTSAFAAGNRCMVKLSENSRHLAELLIERSPAYFEKDKLQFFDETGGVGIEFSKLKFDHLLFTGSGATGRAVMTAAVQNLCPVTLELGGKSPALVCDDFPLRKAVERITFFKYFNAGQICTTADHVFVPQAKVAEFVGFAKKVVSKRYANLESKDYTSIIDSQAFKRITQDMKQAQDQGATLVPLIPGKKWDAKTHKIAPHIVLDAPPECALRTREIFGPVLPVVAYNSIEDVIQTINSGPRPLAFYPFSNSTKLIHTLLHRVMSGGATVNDIVLHTGQHDMPFGGVGESGMGHYHGYEGFVTFSKMRPVFYQTPISSIQLLWPPYGRFATQYLDFLTK